jgi:hypothetical protein
MKLVLATLLAITLGGAAWAACPLWGRLRATDVAPRRLGCAKSIRPASPADQDRNSAVRDDPQGLTAEEQPG